MGRAVGLRRAIALQVAVWVAAVITAGCGVTDPRLDDLEVTGSVAAQDGAAVSGATVTLIRKPCADSTCMPRARGADMTASDGTFRIVTEREAVERDSWELVCHEFTISVDAAGFVPIVGDYQAWRGTFCASGEAQGIELRLQPTG